LNNISSHNKKKAKAGEPDKFQVKTLDSQGNPVPEGGAKVTAVLHPEVGSEKV
jgi:hypothetical protein